MRLNQYLALHSTLSRRSADAAIAEGRVRLNDKPASVGSLVSDSDVVMLDGQLLQPTTAITTLLLHKPAGFVCSRQGQGSRTIYDLLPANLRHLQTVGRLDKDSSGLLILTNDGYLAHSLTHPSFKKTKEYEVKLDKSLNMKDEAAIRKGVLLDDGPSVLQLVSQQSRQHWQIHMQEGRNRQIRRTFAALGYKIKLLHRTRVGAYKLAEIKSGEYSVL